MHYGSQAAVATQEHEPSFCSPFAGKPRDAIDKDAAMRCLTDTLCLDPGAFSEAQRRRFLTFTRYQGKDAWRFGDEQNGCFRRITGEPFVINGEEVKAPADSKGEAWHSLIGMTDIVRHDRRDVLLIVEGSKDAMAALHFAEVEERSSQIGLAVALGSGIKLRKTDIDNLRHRRLRIIGDTDPVGIETVNRIAGQLTTTASEVQTLNLQGLRRVDGKAVKDLFDATRIDYDDFEANHDLSCLTDLDAHGPRVMVSPKAEVFPLPPSPPSQLLYFSDSMRTHVNGDASMRGGTSWGSVPTVEQILIGTIPAQDGMTNRLLFNVARGIWQAEELAGKHLPTLRREVAARWLEQAREHVDPTFDVELVELQLDMKIKAVKTPNPFTVALADLDTSRPVDHPELPLGSKLERLARLCRNMAVQLDGTFSLSQRQAAQAMGYNDNHAGAAMLQKLEGIAITCIDRGKPYERGKQPTRAKGGRFRYVLPLERATTP